MDFVRMRWKALPFERVTKRESAAVKVNNTRTRNRHVRIPAEGDSK